VNSLKKLKIINKYSDCNFNQLELEARIKYIFFFFEFSNFWWQHISRQNCSKFLLPILRLGSLDAYMFFKIRSVFESVDGI
jgi:hypothetical protein